jgi:hypothetical protein
LIFRKSGGARTIGIRSGRIGGAGGLIEWRIAVQIAKSLPPRPPRYTKEKAVSIDRFPQRTIDWLSLPVLADPFWGRAAFPVRSRCGKTASIFQVLPRLARLGQPRAAVRTRTGEVARPHTKHKESLCTR